MTRPLFHDQELDAWGLSEARPGPCAALDLQQLQTLPQGFAGAAELADAIADPAAFLPTRNEAAAALQARVEVHSANQAIWRVLMGQPLRQPLAEPPGAIYRAEQGCAYLDTRLLPDALAVIGQDGRALGLRRGAQGQWTLGALLPALPLEEQDPLAGLRAPLEPWARSLPQEMGWLRRRLEAAARAASPWAQALAIGESARLWPLDASVEPEQVRRWLQGQSPAPTVAPHASLTWARRQDPELLYHLEERAVAAAHQLQRDLERLRGEHGGEEEAWPLHLLAWLERREQLEGLALVLREAFAGDLLTAALRDLDPQGQALLEATAPGWPPGAELELLRRSLQVDPGSWWAQAALWEVSRA